MGWRIGGLTQGTKEEESKALKNISDNQESSEESRYPPSPNDRRLVEAHPLTSETSDRATIDNAVFIEAGTRASKTSDIIKLNE